MKKKPPVRLARPGKERILDAAEQLFAQRGFEGTALRDVAQAAGVDADLPGDRFDGKRGLLEAVFERRAAVLNRERLALLEGVRRAARPGAPALEAILGAYSQPLLERSVRGDPGWKSYFALLAYVNNSPELAPVLMTRHFDAVADRFVAALCEALPDCPPGEIYWGCQFLTGALTLTFAETGRLDKLSGGLCGSSDLEGGHQRLAPWAAAGFRALAARAVPALRPGKRMERRARPRR